MTATDSDSAAESPRGPWGWSRYLLLAWLLIAPDREGPPQSVRRFLVLAAIGLPAALLQLFHRVCLALDHILFPGFQSTAIERPLFIVGVPRSGTTFTHRLIAGDCDQFTTCRLWELVLAPSILQKKFFLAAASVDRWFGRPLGRLVRRADRALFQGLEGVHGSSLFDAEEDFLALLPYGACFLLVLAFPQPGVFWPLGAFDRALAEADRNRVLAWYRGLVQRHLYVLGQGRRYLCKNPSFSSWVRSFSEEFPDCRIVANVRTPAETVPSQLSSVVGGLKTFGDDPARPAVRDRFVDLLAFYYAHLAEVLRELTPQRYAILRFSDLTSHPRLAIEAVYDRLGYELGESFSAALVAEESKAKTYRSAHHYSAEQFGLDDAEIEARFGPLWAQFELAEGGDFAARLD